MSYASDFNAVHVVISYSHKDESFRNKIEKCLIGLKHQKFVTSWDDQCIQAGEEWAKALEEKFLNADIILLLVSFDFIASKFCYDTEMKEALVRHNHDEAVVIPVIIRPCCWKSLPFSKLQTGTRNGKPVSKYVNSDDAYVEITENIEMVARRLIAKKRKKININR